MARHTINKLPWHAESIADGALILSDAGHEVARCKKPINADLIVTAVNERDQLRDALRRMVGAYGGNRGMSAADCMRAYHEADALLHGKPIAVAPNETLSP